METTMFVINVTHLILFLKSVVYFCHVKQDYKNFINNKVIFCVNKLHNIQHHEILTINMLHVQHVYLQ